MRLSIQKNTQLLAVRDASLQRLTRFANKRETDIQHCYLFQKDKFAGVSYHIGVFKASWFWGDSEIRIYRGTNLIDQFPIQKLQSKAA